jgi:hypothetical protein
VPQLIAKDPAAAQADPERAEWIFPAADELPGGEQSWGDVLDKRLARIERDLELEPNAIRRTFAVATAPRIEPAGAIVLWPQEVA